VPTERDLSAETFVVLRRALFDGPGLPLPFQLRDKRNTQDDPLDEHLQVVVDDALASEHVSVQRSSGPLISPDMALVAVQRVRQRLAKGEPMTRADVVGIEVKKLERTASGRVARATGLDFNTTPPSEVLTVLGPGDQQVEIPGSYLIVIQEPADEQVAVTALVMCDGALLNEDVALYKSVVNVRTKLIGLGSYGDGVDRQRPMLIFTNPLSVGEFDAVPTLVSGRADLADTYDNLRLVGMLGRTRPDGSKARFHCYRVAEDEARAASLDLTDPFPVPARTEETHARGRFRLDL